MIAHKRIRMVDHKMVEAPLQYYTPYDYGHGWTDVRIVEMPSEAFKDAVFAYSKGQSVEGIATSFTKIHQGDFLLFNGPYVDKTSGTILGKTIMSGKVMFPEIAGKTESREHLYFRSGKLGIGRVDDPAGIDFAVEGSPVLVDGGKNAVLGNIQRDHTAPDIAYGTNPRTAVGLKSDGSYMFIFVDGRGGDAGLTLEDLADLFIELDCVKAINLDGGSSSVLLTNNTDLQKWLDMKGFMHLCDDSESVSATLSHALAIQFDPDKLLPKVTKGIDSASKHTEATVKAFLADGYEFFGRYFTIDAFAWKRTDASEVKTICGAGGKMVTFWEREADRAKEGQAAGVADAIEAARQAKAVGMPQGEFIWYTADYDVPTTDYDAIEKYLKGAKQGSTGAYKVGLYGPYALLIEMSNRGAADGYMQAAGWSGNRVFSGAMVVQKSIDQTLHGMSVDTDEAYGEDAWWTLEQQTSGSVETTEIILNGKVIGTGKITDGTTWVPIRLVAEACGKKVSWDGKNVHIDD